MIDTKDKHYDCGDDAKSFSMSHFGLLIGLQIPKGQTSGLFWKCTVVSD